MRDTTRYEIFKDDPPKSPRWLEPLKRSRVLPQLEMEKAFIR